MALAVQCVDVGPNPSDCRDIERIGLPGQNTDVVYKTPQEVYDIIEKKGRTVVVEHNGTETEVEGVDATPRYVRSEPNDTKDDNLLKQQSC